MNREQLVRRIMLQNRHLAIEENITICDSYRIKLSEIRGQIEAKSFDYILIDYLQLIESENEELSGEDMVLPIIRGLRNLARELGIPIIAMSQMNRNDSDDLAEINVSILSQDPYHSPQLAYKSLMKNNGLITHFDFDSDTTEVIDYGDFLSFNDLVMLYALDRSNLDGLNINMLFEAKKNPIKHTFPHLNEILHNTTLCLSGAVDGYCAIYWWFFRRRQ